MLNRRRARATAFADTTEPRSAVDAVRASLSPGLELVTVDPVAAPIRLHPGEAALVAGASPARQADFAAGRHCARLALTRFGNPPVPILMREAGEPAWPNGFVGSISHCPTLAAALMGPSTEFASVGLDVERRQTLTAGMRELVCASPAEGQWMQDRADGDLVVFSIKEAVLKAWWPLTNRWPDFVDIEVVACEDGSFSATVDEGVRGRATVDGIFAVDAALACSVALVAAGNRPR